MRKKIQNKSIKESFRMFTEMLDSLKHHVITTLTRVRVRTQEEMEEAERARQEMAARINQNNLPVDENSQTTQNSETEDYSDRRIGRNEPCPCGSGKNISIVTAVVWHATNEQSKCGDFSPHFFIPLHWIEKWIKNYTSCCGDYS